MEKDNELNEAEELAEEEQTVAFENEKNNSDKTKATPSSRLIYIYFDPPDPDSADFWEEDTASKGRFAHITVKAIILTVAVVLIFSYMIALQHGRGWFYNLITGKENIEFTLPIAETPELDGKYVNPDGSYTAAGVAKAALPSVVQIKSYDGNVMIPASQGSGIIISEDGYIVTNAHVVSDAEYGITAQLYDKTEYSAKLVGKDDSSDIAVLKIGAKDLRAAQFADSDLCELGDDVVTIGSPAGYENSVTKGIISGLDRQIHAENSATAMQCIQIDAAINPGNSGGPLFNMWGQVIGITSSKLVSSSYDNIGFAITVNSAKPIIEQLMEYGYIPDKPRVGISYYSISDGNAELYGSVAGLYIVEIDPECHVAETELQPGDIITEMNGKAVEDENAVSEIMNGLKAGDTMTCKVFRPASEDDLSEENGSYFEITFELDSDKTAMIRVDSSEDE